MIAGILFEGLILGVLLVFVCIFGIRNSAADMVFLYHKDVQERCVELGYITHEKIRRNRILFKLFCIPGYMLYVVVCAYIINGARGFWQGFLHIFSILSVLNIIDRFVVDELWVGHTKMWEIPGTEDLKPYINRHDKCMKWLAGTLGMMLISAILAGIMTIFIK